MLGASPPSNVVVNELTTVASAYTNARFIQGEAISGNALGLKIAAGNAPNLVDPATGTWGPVLLDPLNSTQTTTLASLDTLGSLITAYATGVDDGWRARFLKAATPSAGAAPTNTLEAMADIARESWVAPKDLFAFSTKPILSRRTGRVGRRRSCPTSPMFPLTSPSASPSPAAESIPRPADVRCRRQFVERTELDGRLAVRRPSTRSAAAWSR